ncbi:hypothetical protein JTE90_015513 [Oedothorax gibbosus]|uniref:Smr domain-containing protein n=1 Tax=Oedothorax gibbosus TaxID=931172 RepID=A0AAV6VPW4_9ARAC|nr:hypothetical protein JTE90_015513 [Oedothorax gibbosus]
MSKRMRGKSAQAGSDRGRLTNKCNIGSEVFRNSSAVCDDTDPHQSLKYLIEIFSSKIEEDVISMIFSECAFDVDQSLETLMSLTSDDHGQPPISNVDQKLEQSDNCTNFQQLSNQTAEEVSVLNNDTSIFHDDDKPNNYVEESSSSTYLNDLSFSSSDQSLLSVRSSKNEPNTVNSYSSLLYSSLFSPSNLAAGAIPNSNNNNNNKFSHGIQFDKTVPEQSPQLLYNNCWSNSQLDGTTLKHNDAVNHPTGSGQSKKANRKPTLEDLKWKEDANRLRYAKDLIESGFSVLVLLRGLPGSGKSTLAQTLKSAGVVLSTDDFFGQNGEYNFDPMYLQEAHEWNKKRATTALSQNVSPVIIDNTNTESWEMAPYVQMGKKFNYTIVILEPLTDWKFKPSELMRRNHHGVRKEAIVRMLDRYQHNITVESFAENVDIPMPKPNKMLGADISLPNNLHITHSTNSIKEEVKTNKLVSLEAVVHQEEMPNDSLLDDDYARGSETTNPKMLLRANSLSLDNKNILLFTKCPKCTEKADALENIALTTKTKTFESLEEIKSFVQEDSDDTLSLCNDCILLQASVNEDSSWEEVTEHDNDFLWTAPVQDHGSNSSSLSSIQLQNDFASPEAADNRNMDVFEEGLSQNEQLPNHDEVFEKANNASVLNNPLDLIQAKPSNIFSYDSNNEAGIATKNHLSENTFSEKATNLSCQDMNSETAVADYKLEKNCQVMNTKTVNDGTPFDLQSLKDDNYEHKQENNQLYQNLKISRPKFDSSISTKYEGSHKNNLASENDNQSKPSPMRLSSQSFDEVFVLRESKTKEIEKNIGTNLLRSKFNSVPILEDIDNNSVENGATSALNSSSETGSKDKNCKINVKSCSDSSDTRLWIRDDVEGGSWSNIESQGCPNKAKANAPIRDKDSNHNLISNSTASFTDPKPQRTNLKTTLSSSKNFKENNSSQKFLTLINDCSEKHAASDWDGTVENEPLNKNNEAICDKSFHSPKPPRNVLKSNKFNNLTNSSIDNFVAKSDELGDLNDSPNTSQNCQRSQKKRSPLLKHVEKYLNNDWTFPQFVPNNTSSIPIPEKLPVSNYTTETQTEPLDFVQINKLETCNYECNFRIITPSPNIYEHLENSSLPNAEPDVIPVIARFEKSTCTDDLVLDTEVSKKMDTLHECFPDISEDDLKHLLELCHEDEAWMINLLLDSGYKYNNPNAQEMVKNSFSKDTQSSKLEEENETVPHVSLDTVNKPGELFKSEDAKTVCIVPENCSSTCEASSESKTDSENTNSFQNSRPLEKMQLVLDSEFALQLEELFGQKADIAALPSSPAERTIEIDLEFAKLLYEKWKNPTKSKTLLNTIEGTDSKSKKNKNKSQVKHTPPKNMKVMQLTPKESMSFSEIMDMEYALQVHKNQKLNTDEDFATKLKRIELYNMFPGADTIALDEIFEANDYSLKNSVLAIGEDFGEPNTDKTEQPELPIVETNDNCDKLKVLQEFENNDWSDWVFKECNLDSETDSSSSSTISPEALELRKEAAEHCVLRQKFIQKAQEAHSRGMRDAGAFYAQKGREHAVKFKEANKAACDLIVQQRNPTSSSQVLDIHGLFVQEAIPYVDEFLKAELQKRPQNSLTKVSIITGQGNHSIRGPKLGPAVMEYLKKCGYRFAEVNRGVLEVYLKCE